MLRSTIQIARLLTVNHATKFKQNSLINRINYFDCKFYSLQMKTNFGTISCIKTPTFKCTTNFLLTCALSTDNSEESEEEREYAELVKRTLKISDTGHQVLVIQPYIKWGKLKKRNTTPQLLLDEAVALVHSLPLWKVVDAKIISMLSFDKVKLFGKGNSEMLSQIIQKNKNITAVFISINMLNPLQQKVLEEAFGVPVFDRFTLVVQIFKLHATTREAKIQVAMGEIPYLWTRIRDNNEGLSDKMGGGATVGGPGETYIEKKRRLLQNRERKLKNELNKLKTQRALLRNRRKELSIPTVAVVGYTNAGKTSIIKALTREEKLKPRNVLFATLDVTVHAGFLPSGLKVLYVDTVGFLSDIPTGLIQSFVATLEDAVQSDLIIHVVDASHPNSKAQSEHVIDTLKSINLSENLLENMITVANKTDLVPNFINDFASDLPVSAVNGSGLDNLKRRVEECIIKATGQIFIKIRVPNGGEEYNWLRREATVVNVAADENDNQFLFMNTLITDAKLNIFKHKFISSKFKKGIFIGGTEIECSDEVDFSGVKLDGCLSWDEMDKIINKLAKEFLS